VKQLVANLGDDDTDVRKTAAKKLETLDEAPCRLCASPCRRRKTGSWSRMKTRRSGQQRSAYTKRAEVALALVPSVVRTPGYLTPQRRRGNLLLDGSFRQAPGKPWLLWSWRGNRDVFAVVAGASRSGKTAAVLRSVVDDHALLSQKVAVKPHTLYLLSGWIKTRDVTVVDRRGRMGASLCGGSEASRSLVGTHGWTYVTVVFDSGARKEIELGCRLGYSMSTATGTAWFDDLVLVEIPMAELVHTR
jgi:hypothetical protein